MPQTKEQHAEQRQMLIDRRGGKCVRCGTTEQLEFDHIDPSTKIGSVMMMLYRGKLALAIEEADKCQLLCNPCHTKKDRMTPMPEHGTRARYRSRVYKCRCDLCKRANADYMKEYRGRFC